jgi:hypothetical protein
MMRRHFAILASGGAAGSPGDEDVIGIVILQLGVLICNRV